MISAASQALYFVEFLLDVEIQAGKYSNLNKNLCFLS